MPMHQYIAAHGFRKWYERELIRGHSHLVMLLLCAIAVIGGFEAMAELPRAQRWASMAVSVLVAAAVGAWAMRRYLFLLLRAERVANQAVCPQCETYARWQILHHDVHEEDEQRTSTLTVRCRKCQHEWRIDW